MNADDGPWIVILVTAAVTFLLRASGYWLMARVPLTPAVRRGLAALPASLFVATVAPIALKAGAPGVAATIATALAMVLTKRELPALLTGLGVAAGLRAAGF
jgi:uncharacterized membrane protein